MSTAPDSVIARSRRRVAAELALVVAVLLLGGCIALSLAPPCSFDPPPGDFSDLPVVNDTKTTALVRNRNAAPDTRDSVGLVMAAGARVTITVESCDGDLLDVTEQGNQSRHRCLRAPILADAQRGLSEVRVSAAVACPS